jgi:hypothetical protein
MHHRSLVLKIGIAVLALAGTLGALVMVLKHERQVYLRGAVPPGQARVKHSRDFLAEFSELWNGLVTNKGEWQATFTETQINSFFEEDFRRSGYAEQFLPKGISAPRVALEQDRLRLGFRYGVGFWSTVVTIDLRVWLAPREPNVVALELQGVHAGALPISPHTLLDQIRRFADRSKLEVRWYRYDGNPVALLRFPDQTRSTAQVRQLQLQPGRLSLAGGPVGAQRKLAATDSPGSR